MSKDTIKVNMNVYDIPILVEQLKKLEQENKQLKEQLENKIDLYEDTISYQLGFDKGKEYLQQKIDKAIEILKDTSVNMPSTLLIETIDYARYILGDKENE